MIEHNGEILLTKSEATQALHTTRATLWRHIKAGNVPFVEILGKQYIAQKWCRDAVTNKWVLLNGVKMRACPGKREKLQEL
jgi:predicted DNA-binding transcriptional regulator AlpA